MTSTESWLTRGNDEFTRPRKNSESGVNRRPSGQQVLTEDTDSFAVGDEVYVDGVKKGRIEFIGETQFGPGIWAGVILEERLGSNDGSVAQVRYFDCKPGFGIFARLFRLTREPIEAASGVLDQMRKYGYEVVEVNERRTSNVERKLSNEGRRSAERKLSNEGRKSAERRIGSEMLRKSVERKQSNNEVSRASNERRFSSGQGDRRSVDRRSSDRKIDDPRRTLTETSRKPNRSSVTSRTTTTTTISSGPFNRVPRASIGADVRIERDPDLTNLAAEARRLSMNNNKSLPKSGQIRTTTTTTKRTSVGR